MYYNKVMDKQIKRVIRDIEIRKKASELRWEKGKNYTRKELDIMAKAAGVKYFCRRNKHDLAEKLGVELPRPRRPFSRAVEICNSGGETVRYPSMVQASKAYGIFPAQVSAMVAKGEARFL